MNIIKKLLLDAFGDGFFGLERDQNTQEQITNGYREYQKKHKKPEPEPTSVCYAPLPKGWDVQSNTSTCIGVCAGGIAPSFTSGQHNTAIGYNAMRSCNDQFIDSYSE